MKFTKNNLRAIITALVIGAIGYEVQVMIQNALNDFYNKRPDYSRIGRVRARRGKESGFRVDGRFYTDDEDEWLVKTIDI